MSVRRNFELLSSVGTVKDCGNLLKLDLTCIRRCLAMSVWESRRGMMWLGREMSSTRSHV